MSELKPSDFREFFRQLHSSPERGKELNPFPWQEDLAEQVCSGQWPEVIDLPTASGKTACIDIALFALACQSNAPRRIFFVVDRRVVVDEAFLRMTRIADRLDKSKGAPKSVLGVVAGRLQEIAGSCAERPLETYQLRGGAYRDESWVKTPLQPTVVASTVDQVGSRLLFRGYGVRDKTWPIHAGLIANDALIFLDEAHCSRAFAQTLQAIQRFRGPEWAEEPISKPFHFVEMTATPSRSDHARIFSLSERDRQPGALQRRLNARKPIQLVEVKGKKDDFEKLATELATQAVTLAASSEAKRIAVMVNRVRTARLVHQQLKKRAENSRVDLVIGSMRPVDRDDVNRSLNVFKSGEQRTSKEPVRFVVSTQCLEVGADLDFDVLVSECASIDALQQRFGRLDRLGEFGRATGAIVIGSWQIEPKEPDPIYGTALSDTWLFLKSLLDLNMGIEAREGEELTVAQHLKKLLKVDADKLRLLGKDAPALLPAHLDTYVQTSPQPRFETSPELFLHGPVEGVAEVQVVWRADLNLASTSNWSTVVQLCPPISAEGMPVRLATFRRWLSGSDDTDPLASDLEGTAQPEQTAKEETKSKRCVLVWRGDKNELVTDPKNIRPGDTVVVAVDDGGWGILGYIPPEAARDVADRAAFQMRRHVSLRLHDKVIAEWPQSEARQAVGKVASSPDAEKREILDALEAYRDDPATPKERWPYPLLEKLGKLKKLQVNNYPADEKGYFIDAWNIADRDKNKETSKEAIPLGDHTQHVQQEVAILAAALFPAELHPVFQSAAGYHDYGKADLRFQAYLRGGDTLAAQLAREPIAKSGRLPVGDWGTCGLPDGFRHELLSLLFAGKCLPDNATQRSLILHLIASHHGRCRPFAPVILDPHATCVSYAGLSLCSQERQDCAAHRLDSGVSDRFWLLTRRYGWWGLAYLEAVLRLADWAVSESEAAVVNE